MDELPHLKALRTRLKLGADAKLASMTPESPSEVNSDERLITVVATTSKTDLDDEVVLASGGDFGYISAVKSVFVDHKYDNKDFVGKIRTITPRRDANGDVTAFVVVFHCTKNALGDEILRQAREDGIFVSIGFKALDWSPPTREELVKWPGAVNVIRSWKMLELSVTHIPANQWAAQVDGPPPIVVGKTAVTIWPDGSSIVERNGEVKLRKAPRTVVVA